MLTIFLPQTHKTLTLSQRVTQFGLDKRAYDTDPAFDPSNKKTQWQRLAHKISSLNQASEANVFYKLLYLARHGEGVHNVASKLYGIPAWNVRLCLLYDIQIFFSHLSLTVIPSQHKWSKLNGNNNMTWLDAHLTLEGKLQARQVHALWSSQIPQHIPLPEKYYTSPLDRCCATAQATFSDLPLPEDRPFKPEVKELLRERLHGHTCNRRSSKSYIERTYPGYTFEAGFTEEDELWRAGEEEEREQESETDERLRRLLDDVFANDVSMYVSFTSHAMAIAAILRVVGHREFFLDTGAVLPVLVQAERVAGNGESAA